MSSTAADVILTPLKNPTDARPVSRHDLLLPPTGNWSLRVEMPGDVAIPDGPISVQYSASTLQGYVTRAGSDRGQYIGIIVGGRAQTAQQGLDKLVTAQHYFQAPASNILTATLSQVGEALATDSVGLSTVLNYPRRATRCSDALDEIADMLGLIWRVKLDGSVWFGNLTWPASIAKFVYESKQPDVAAPLLMPGAQQPLIEPGQTIILDNSASASAIDKTAQKVLCAHYYGDAKATQARLWFQDPNADLVTDDKLAPDRLHAGIAAIAKQACRGTDWHRQFQGQVVTQRADGSLDVNLDTIYGQAEIPPIRGAQVSVPVGGAALSVRGGDRVTIYFEGGDPRKPRAGLYETGGATRGVALLNSAGTAGTLVLIVTPPGVLSGTYVDPFGAVTVVGPSVPIPLKFKITSDVSVDLKLRG